MPTPAEVDDLQQAVNDVRTVAVGALVASWAAEVAPDPANALDIARTLMTEIAAEYAQAAAATAVDFYTSVRPPASPRFTPVPVVRPDLIGGGTQNWATQPLLTEDPADALDRVAAEVMLAVQQVSVETIGGACDEDPLDVHFARFPTNPDPCSYCVLRASRGAIYWSEETATRGDHRECGCKVTPIFPGEPLPYQRKPYMGQYLDGASAASDELAAIRADKSLSPTERRDREFKALLAGMRRANGIR